MEAARREGGGRRAKRLTPPHPAGEGGPPHEGVRQRQTPQREVLLLGAELLAGEDAGQEDGVGEEEGEAFQDVADVKKDAGN